MIDPVSSQITPQNLSGNIGAGQETPAALRLRKTAAGEFGDSRPVAKPDSDFADLVTDFVRKVDEKSKVAGAEAKQLMLGESDNLHRSMIAMQESGLAFTMLVEVRNKLVEAYQELMRMPV